MRKKNCNAIKGLGCAVLISFMSQDKKNPKVKVTDISKNLWDSKVLTSCSWTTLVNVWICTYLATSGKESNIYFNQNLKQQNEKSSESL